MLVFSQYVRSWDFWLNKSIKIYIGTMTKDFHFLWRIKIRTKGWFTSGMHSYWTVGEWFLEMRYLLFLHGHTASLEVTIIYVKTPSETRPLPAPLNPQVPRSPLLSGGQARAFFPMSLEHHRLVHTWQPLSSFLHSLEISFRSIPHCWLLLLFFL